MPGKAKQHPKGGKKLTLAKVEKQIRKIQKADAPEVKRVGVTGSVGTDFNGHVDEILAIPQGLTASTRVGDQINVRALVLRWATYGSTLATASGGSVRFMIIMDTQNTGVAPLLTDILQNTGSAQSLLSPINFVAWDDKRFHVVYDHTLHGNSTSYLSTYFASKTIKVNRRVHYKGPNSGDCTKNRLYAVYFSDVGVNVPYCGYTLTVEYTDA